MRFFYLIFLVLFLQVNAFAYAKKIVLVSTHSEQGAKRFSYEVTRYISKDKDLYKTLKSKDISVQVHKRKEYFIVSIRVFVDKKTLLRTLKVIRKKYKSSYIRSTTAPKKKKLKTTTKVEKKQEVKKKAVLKTKPKIKKKKIIVQKKKPEAKKKKIEKKETKIIKKVVAKVVPASKNIEAEKIDKKIKKIIQEEKVILKKSKDKIKDKTKKKEPKKDVKNNFAISDYIYDFIFFVVFLVALYYGRKFKRIYDEY